MPGSTETHYEMWYDIDGERRHRRANTKEELKNIVAETGIDLVRHARSRGDVQSEESDIVLDANIETLKVTLKKETVK